MLSTVCFFVCFVGLYLCFEAVYDYFFYPDELRPKVDSADEEDEDPYARAD